MSCAGNGYLTSNKLIAFPFEDGQFLAWSASTDAASAQLALQKCFVDASVNIMCQTIPTGGWPVIGNFQVNSLRNVLSFTLSVCQEDVSLSISSDSNIEFPIINGKANWGWYTIIVSSEGLREFLESTFTPPSSGPSSSTGRDGDYWLRLCTKCVSQKPFELTSIRVYDGVQSKSSGPHFVLTGDVSIKPGNNILLSEPDSDTGLTINAEPGAGLGIVECQCTSNEGDKPQIIGGDGHTRLFNDTCFDFEPSITVENGKRVGHLQIHGKCTACCQCSMYESIVNDRLAPLANTVRELREELSGYLSIYEDAVKRFNNRMIKPTMDDISISLTGMKLGSNVTSKLDGNTVKGKMARCSFSAIVRNLSYADITVRVTSISSGSGRTIREITAVWSYENGEPKSLTTNTSVNFNKYDFTLYPGRSLVINFIATFDTNVTKVDNVIFYGNIQFYLSYRTSGGLTGGLGPTSKSLTV